MVKERPSADVLTSEFGAGGDGTDNARAVCWIIDVFVTSLLTTLLEKQRL